MYDRTVSISRRAHVPSFGETLSTGPFSMYGITKYRYCPSSDSITSSSGQMLRCANRRIIVISFASAAAAGAGVGAGDEWWCAPPPATCKW